MAKTNTTPKLTTPCDGRVRECLALVHEFFPKPEAALAWLSTPHPELDGRTAFEVLETQPDAVLTLLANAREGIPL